MKKIYSLLLACSFAAVGTAQVEICESGQTTDISGTTYTKIVDQPSIVSFSMPLKNVSGDPMDVQITRLQLNHPVSWLDDLTWGDSTLTDGGCYAYSQMPANPWTTPGVVHLENNSWGWLRPNVYVDVPGTGTYRYYVNVGGTLVDSVDVQVIYSTLAVEEPEIVKGMTAYPNPANDLLTVSATGLEEYRIRMTDVLGKIVFDETASSPKRSIDVSALKNGVYMVTVLEKGTVIRTRRVVVKH